MRVDAVADGSELVLTVRIPFSDIFKGGAMPPVEQLPISLPKKLPKRLKPKKPRKPRVPKRKRARRVEEPDEDEKVEDEEIVGEPDDDEPALVARVEKASVIASELEKIEEAMGVLSERCKAAFSAIQAGKQERPDIADAAGIPYSSLSPVLLKLEQKHLIKKIGFGKFAVVNK